MCGLYSGDSMSPFCDKFSSSNQGSRYGCTADRLYKGTCNLVHYSTSLPQEYQVSIININNNSNILCLVF